MTYDVSVLHVFMYVLMYLYLKYQVFLCSSCSCFSHLKLSVFYSFICLNNGECKSIHR